MLLVNRGIKNAHLLPVFLAVGNKLQVFFGNLINVVRIFIVEYHVQGDVEIAVVDGAVEFSSQPSNPKKHDPFMRLQEVVSAVDQLLASGFR